MRLRYRFAGAALALLIFQGALAARRDDWANLNSLRPGGRVRVTQLNHTWIEGTFQAATESGILIRTDHEVTLPKSDVARVDQYSSRRRLVKIMIGAGVGVAVGAIINGTLGVRLQNEGSDIPAEAWIGGSTAIGAGIGALAGGNYKTIYRHSPSS
jgi:hypothetical protein